MKKLITALALAAVVTACRATSTDNVTDTSADTATGQPACMQGDAAGTCTAKPAECQDCQHPDQCPMTGKQCPMTEKKVSG